MNINPGTVYWRNDPSHARNGWVFTLSIDEQLYESTSQQFMTAHEAQDAMRSVVNRSQLEQKLNPWR